MIRLERVIGLCGCLMALFGLAPVGSGAQAAGAVVALAALGAHGVLTAALAGRPWLPALWTGHGRVYRHALDVSLLLLLLASTGGAHSPFFTYLLFSVLAGALRWGPRGAFWTAFGILAIYGLFAISWFREPQVSADMRWVGVRLVILAVSAALLGYVVAGLRMISVDPAGEEASLAAVLEGVADGVLLADEAGRIRTANAAAARIFRTTSSALLDKDVRTLLSDVRVLTEIAGDVEDTAAREPARHVREFDGLRWDGTRFTGEVTVGLLRLRDRRVYVGVIRDVSERKEREARERRSLEVEAAEEERVQLIQDLHDGLLQTLTGAALQLKIVQTLMRRDVAAADERLTQVRNALAAEQQELRFWASDVKPAIMGVRAEALQDQLAGTLERIGRTWGIEVGLHFAVPSGLTPSTARQVYRLVQESVVNAAKHGGASLVEVEVEGRHDSLFVSITDNGRGFPYKGLLTNKELEERRLGPVHLKHRVRRAGGTLSIRSSVSSARLEIILPVGRDA